MSNNYFCKIDVINNSNDYYLMSETIDINEENKFKYELSLISINESFKGIIDFEEYKQLNQNNESFDELNKKQNQLMEAIRNGSNRMTAEDSTVYCYELEIISNNLLKFYLSLYESEERIAKIPLLDIKCQQLSNEELMANVFHKMVLIFQFKDRLIEELKEQNKSLRSLSQKSIESLDDFSIKKEENDSLIFTKFVAILNEKKKKIRELEEMLKNR